MELYSDITYVIATKSKLHDKCDVDDRSHAATLWIEMVNTTLIHFSGISMEYIPGD